jgi:acyl carrier protein
MQQPALGEAPEKADLEGTVISVLNDLTADWDLELDGGIGPSTRLMADLAFESIDVVQFIVSLEQKLGRKGIAFENLFMRDGDYVHELTVEEIVAFLGKNLD